MTKTLFVLLQKLPLITESSFTNNTFENISSMIFERFMFGSEFTAEFNGRGNQSAARNHKGGHENNSTS